MVELNATLAASYASAIGSSDGGITFGHTKLLAPEKGLSGELVREALTDLRHLTFVDLSGNRLCSLAGLVALPALSTLVAPHNNLVDALDFAAPPAGSRLRRVNLCDCSIGHISAHASSHIFLEELQLDGNRLTSLDGLGGLAELQTLSCAANLLHDATAAASLRRLRSLCLSRNELREAPPMAAPALTALDVAENKLTDLDSLLKALTPLTLLRQLSLRGNAFDVEIGIGVHAATVVTWGFDEVQPDVRGAYRARVLGALPWVTSLDGETPVSFDEMASVVAAAREGAGEGDGDGGGDGDGDGDGGREGGGDSGGDRDG